MLLAPLMITDDDDDVTSRLGKIISGMKETQANTGN